jgi:hypothetical protein
VEECELEWHCKTVDKDKELLQAHRLIKDLQRQVRKAAAEAEAVTARAAAEARLFALNYARANSGPKHRLQLCNIL